MKTLGDTIARDPTQAVNLTYCAHHQTLAKVGLENGVVTRWEMARPHSWDSARAAMQMQADLSKVAARSDFTN